MAIVTSTNGSIDTFASNPTDLILDISGYFDLAPNANLPSVVFIGDDVTADWATTSPAFAQNPNWINKGVPGQTSGQVLARFETDVVDLHPAIVNIITGTYDVSAPGWFEECGGGGNPMIQTCTNLDGMIQMATSAFIKVIVGTIPPYGADDSSVYGFSELFDRGLKRQAGYSGSLFSTPSHIYVRTIKLQPYHRFLSAGRSRNYPFRASPPRMAASPASYFQTLPRLHPCQLSHAAP